MKYRRSSRALSVVLLIAMVLTLMPTVAFAEDSAVTESWELIGGADAIDAAAAEVYRDAAIHQHVAVHFAILPATNADAMESPVDYITTYDDAARIVVKVDGMSLLVDVRLAAVRVDDVALDHGAALRPVALTTVDSARIVV